MRAVTWLEDHEGEWYIPVFVSIAFVGVILWLLAAG